MMQDLEIDAMAARLEEAVGKERPIARGIQYGGGADESFLSANRAGFLMLASVLLRAAIAPYEEEGKSFVVQVEISDLRDEDGESLFDWLERQEAEPEAKAVIVRSTWKERMEICFLVAFVAAAVMCFVVGAATIVMGIVHVAESVFSFWV